jgi:hypothetical protein
MNFIRMALAAAMLAGVLVLGGSNASAQGVHLFAVLNGGNEISAGGQAKAGDLNGHGAVSVVYTSAGQLCFSIIVHGLDTPAAAHIHQGTAGNNGPVVVNLAPPTTGNSGLVTGCAAVSATTLGQIRSTPSNFYVNVHTNAFPSGAIRGQLF